MLDPHTFTVQFETARRSIERQKAGKILPDACYIHREFLSTQAPGFFSELEAWTKRQKLLGEWNVAKLARRAPKLSLLLYQDLDRFAFPALLHTCVIEDSTMLFRSTDYSGRANRPILHRKELLVDPNHACAGRWRDLTQSAEKYGLFENSRLIGFEHHWNSLLNSKDLEVVGDRLVAKKQER